MTIPETKIRVGLAYRETILLVLQLQPVQMATELRRFYNHFKDFLNFPIKNLEHYPLMIRKLVKQQAVYYEQNRPRLTVKGNAMVDTILEHQPKTFQRKWYAYLELRQ